jgi:ATP/maltotriose-dependent transcriptional regulator MalT
MYDPALADLEAALPLADPSETFDIRHAIGVIHGIGGRIDEAERALRALVDEYRDSPERWKAVGHLGLVAFVRGDITEGARLQEDAFRETPDAEYARYLRSNIAWIMILQGRWDEADVLLREALDDAVSSGNTQDESILSCIAARLAALRGDLASAFDAGKRAMLLSTRLGNPADIITANDALASALIENDMPEDAAAILSPILALDQPGIEPREFSYTYTVLCEACLLAGDLARARTALARARHHLPQAVFWRVAIDRAEAQVDIELGDPSAALHRLRPWIHEPTALAYQQARVLEVAAQALYAIGDRADALARAQEALRIYEQLGARKRAGRLGTWLVERTARRPGRPRSTLPGHLTQRETEILRLIVLGRSNREVAQELFISLGTAKKHVENIMAKAGVSRRTELVPFAVSIGALAVEDLRSQQRPGGLGGRRQARRVIRLDRLEPSEPTPAD